MWRLRLRPTVRKGTSHRLMLRRRYNQKYEHVPFDRLRITGAHHPDRVDRQWQSARQRRTSTFTVNTVDSSTNGVCTGVLALGSVASA